MMLESLPPCRACGGHLQRVASMPGHVVCGSGHLYLEEQVRPDAAATASTPRIRRTVEASRPSTGPSQAG